MARGITGLIGLGATLVVALPVGLLGIELLGRGRTLPGVGLLAVATLIYAVQEYVTTPGDIPTMLAGSVLGRVVPDPDEVDSDEK